MQNPSQLLPKFAIAISSATTIGRRIAMENLRCGVQDELENL